MTSHNPSPCPKCCKPSEFVDCDSVDVGVGIIEGNHVYACPEHGEWGFYGESSIPIFRDDEPTSSSRVPPADIDDFLR